MGTPVKALWKNVSKQFLSECNADKEEGTYPKLTMVYTVV